MKLQISTNWQIFASTQELRDMLTAVQHEIERMDSYSMENSLTYKRMKQLEKDLYKTLEVLPWE